MRHEESTVPPEPSDDELTERLVNDILDAEMQRDGLTSIVDDAMRQRQLQEIERAMHFSACMHAELIERGGTMAVWEDVA
jgi:hypothetical protein